MTGTNHIYSTISSRSPAPPNNTHANSPSPPDTPSSAMVVKTKLQLVDLAGSECVGTFVW